MRRSTTVSALVAAVLVIAGTPAAAASADKHHTAPAPVSRVRAFNDPHGVTIDWTNPGKHFDHLAVRLRRGTQAPRYRHGHFQGRRIPVGQHATSAKLTHLHRNTTYSVAIWTVNKRGIRSAARHAPFTTDGGPVSHGRYTARFVDTTGHPLAGVVGYAVDLETFHDVTALSGRDGKVSFELPAGEYFVGGDGENAIGGASDATGYVGRSVFATIKPRRVLRGGTLVLPAGGLVHVHVADSHGRPAVGVIPSLAPVHQYVSSSSGLDDSFFDAYYSFASAQRTDEHGDTTLRAVPASAPFRVCVDPLSGPEDSTGSRFVAACSQTSALARTGRSVSTTTLVLQRRAAAGTIRGVVRSRDRAGFGGSYIAVYDKNKQIASATSKRDGTFVVDGMPPGTYRVCATGGAFSGAGRSGYLPGCDARPITVTRSTTSRTSTTVLRPGAAATGTVTTPGGVPVAGANVQATRDPQEDSATTDVNGHYLLKGLRPGRHHACVFTDNMVASKTLPLGVLGTCGASHEHFTTPAGRVRTGLNIHLKVAAAVSGTVVDTAGHAVPYAFVDAEPIGTGYPVPTVADAHGRFRVIGLGSGRYRICAGRGDEPIYVGTMARCHHQVVRARTGRLVAGVRITLPETSTVRVNVVDEHDRPVAGVDAAVLGTCRGDCDPGTPVFAKSRTSVAASAVTDSRGTVVLTGIRPGRYAVCLFGYYGTTRAGAPPTGYADRCSGSTFDVDVRPARVTAKRLVLHQGGVVSGRITDSAGDPLQGVLVHVEGSAADDLPAADTEYGGLSGDPYADEDGGAGAAPGYYSSTGADGTYTVRSVRPGRRLVCADPSGATGGMNSGGYLRQCSGGTVGSTDEGTPVVVHSGATTGNVNLALVAAGSITGHVTSHVSRGGTAVVLFRGQKYLKQLHPDSAGNFGFRTLTPGTYFVCVAAFGRTTKGRCYRDAAWDPQTAEGPASDATPVQATAGVVTSGIDITVPR